MLYYERCIEQAKEFSNKMDVEAKKAIGINISKENLNVSRKNIDDIELHEKLNVNLENDITNIENTEEKKVAPKPRRIIKSLGFGKKTTNEEKVPEENIIRNELLGGLDFDSEDNE